MSDVSTKVPGLKARHAIITPRCRAVPRPELHPDPKLAALEEAIGRLRQEYSAIVAMRDDDFNVHVVLTIENS